MLGITLLFVVPPVWSSDFCVEVTDPAGLAVRQAAIALSPAEERAVTVGSTDDQGRFCRAMPGGWYSLKVSSSGFLNYERTVRVFPEKADTVPVELQLAAISDRIQITASRLPESLVDSPVPVQMVSRKEVEQIAARHMGDVVQEQVNIVSFAGGSHSGGSSTNIEGFKSRDVQLLIDGQPLTGRIAGYVDMSEIDTGIIDSVEVQPGASSVMYGSQGMGGAINMVTRRPESGYQIGAEAGYGSFNTGLARLDGGFTAGGLSGYMAAYGLRSLGYNLDPDSPLKTQDPDRQTNLFGSFYLPQIKKLSLGVTGMYFGKRYWGFEENVQLGTYDFERPRQRLVIIPRGSLPTSGNSLLSFRMRHVGYRRTEDVYYRNPRLSEIETNKQSSTGAEGEWNWEISGRRRLGLGGFFNHESVDSPRINTPTNTADRDNGAGFGVIDISLARNLKLDGAIRYDHDSIYGGAWSPRAGIAWHVAEPWSLSFSASRGFRAPDFNELYLRHSHAGGRVVIIGDENLTPQYSWSYSLNSLLRLRRFGRLETRLFRHDMTDLINASFVGRAGIASTYQYENVGEALSTGVAVNYRKNIGRSFDLLTGYQLLSTNNRDEHTPLEYSPRHRFTYRATYWNTKAGLMFSGFGSVTSDSFFGVARSGGWDWMDKFEMIGVTATKTLGKGLSVRATFRNLSDNVDPVYRLTAPRSAEVALIYRFTSE